MEIRIKSYDKNFSQWLNNKLLVRGQRAISHLSRSVYEETIDFNKHLVKNQKQVLRQAIANLSAYQKETGIINLDNSYISELHTLGQMEVNEATLFSKVSTYRKLEPNNPQYEALTTQLKAIQGRIKELKSRIHGEGSLASHAEAYTIRYTAMINANKLLDIDEKSLILAQQNLLSHRYVISYISPASSPIAPTRPYRWWNTFWVLLGTSVLYMILK
jgi:capsule polysaccharide export protein KpsE/RkpR